ncbi:MAG: heme exporter protein CcmD [Caulobacteraceae bacterium]
MNVGHYGAYIIPAYAISAVVLSALVIESLLRARRWKRAAEKGRGPKAQSNDQ